MSVLLEESKTSDDESEDDNSQIIKSTITEEPVNDHHVFVKEFTFLMSTMTELRCHHINRISAKLYVHALILISLLLKSAETWIPKRSHFLIIVNSYRKIWNKWKRVLQLKIHSLKDSTIALLDHFLAIRLKSGHSNVLPSGLLSPCPNKKRLSVADKLVIPNYSSREMYEKMFALGNTMYGQMTAGSFCYIGPQGIVHGTTLTVLNAARRHLGTTDMRGKVFVTSGLGGMSGAQPKAATICGCISVTAEVSKEALEKRHNQGWVATIANNLDECISKIRHARRQKEAFSIGYHGNIVDLWERFVEEYENTGDLLVELGSDQTSCHNPYLGGYYPVQLTYDESRIMMHEDPIRFKNLVQESLRRQVTAINKLSDLGLYFWDYGNAFLLEASRAGADVGRDESATGTLFRYPSYVQDIMGDIFSLGFGPFRWVCTSGCPSDLDTTDEISANVLEDIINEGVPETIKQQYNDNIRWIREAKTNKLVVGSQARILYSDQVGRTKIATAFNNAVKDGKLKGPVVISRDHHDVSGTDSPFRETSNIYDGSAFCADMAVQNVIGDACRGATWVALHNGGGCGWGEVMNGGFGLVLDGSQDAGDRAQKMLAWDVSNGVARRCWSGNNNAEETICRTMDQNKSLKVTLPNHVQDLDLLDRALQE
ncbi:urocanate hydratase [Mytilus galloprovincialis]|uniref:urocanate hydratase n=1 Tax=Mytilus galloprovincialis TaxID=29158 RepID=A0A8B6HLE5_MYTGA|nr:urocanate hydratase [Mytilus galloprovincialis]